MANLKSIKIQRAEVPLEDGQSFEVRAISTNDLMVLVSEHGPTLGVIFGKLTSGGQTPGSLSNESVQGLIFEIAREFPEIAAEVIALAADAYDAEGVTRAGELPVTTQVDAIERVFNLTFASEGSVKKFMETLSRMMLGVSGAMTSVGRTSQIGIGE